MVRLSLTRDSVSPECAVSSNLKFIEMEAGEVNAVEESASAAIPIRDSTK